MLQVRQSDCLSQGEKINKVKYGDEKEEVEIEARTW